MKKNKLLNLILRGGGGGGTGNKTSSDPGELDREPLYTQTLPPEPGVLLRQSTRRKNRQQPPPVISTLRQPVERSTSWKYTNDHSPDAFTINSSPSILDAIRSQENQLNEPPAGLIEKSQSWSGDRLLESATDSGSSRGGTNNNSRAGSASRAGSRTGTLGSTRSSIRRTSGGSQTGRSDHGGDSTPSSVYDHYTTYTDADGYENVELSSPHRIDSGDNSSSHGNGSKLQGSRLNIKQGSRRSRRPSPRRSPLASEASDNADSTVSNLHRSGSVRATVPSISLSTSSPLPIRSSQRSPHRSPSRSPHRSPHRSPSTRSPISRSPSQRSPSQRSPSQRSPTIEVPRPTSRSSSHSPSRSSSRMGSRRSSRSPKRPGRPISGERWHEGAGSPLNINNRSMSYEEHQNQIPLPRPLWKTRSWQQPRNQEIIIADRSTVSKSYSWQQQPRQVPTSESRLAPMQRTHSIITRQEALPSPQHVFAKSRSWQQSHDPEPVPEAPLSRTYTVHERRNPRRSSTRLAPPSSSRSGVSPSRSPCSTHGQISASSGRSGMYYHDDRSSYQQPRLGGQPTYATSNINPVNGPDYVEQRDYEILERQRSIRAAEQYRLEQQRQEQLRQDQMQQEIYLREKYRQGQQKYHDDHHQFTQDQYVRRFHQQQQAPFTQQLSFSHAYSQPNYGRSNSSQQLQLQRQRSGSQRGKSQTQMEQKIYPPREFMNQNELQDEYASIHEIEQNKQNSSSQDEAAREGLLNDRDHAPPIKSASLMSSVELLNTLKRQLALSSPAKTGRSKSMEAGRAAAALVSDGSITDDNKEVSSVTVGSSIPTGLLSPALQALVAEKRARLKRSNVAFSGRGTTARFGILRTVASPSTRCTVVISFTNAALSSVTPPAAHLSHPFFIYLLLSL